jgi:hypothetical protein
LSGCGKSDKRKTNKLVRRKFTTEFKQTNIKFKTTIAPALSPIT